VPVTGAAEPDVELEVVLESVVSVAAARDRALALTA
jgi:hypothetical protein